jgi:hypothetical protein
MKISANWQQTSGLRTRYRLHKRNVDEIQIADNGSITIVAGGEPWKEHTHPTTWKYRSKLVISDVETSDLIALYLQIQKLLLSRIDSNSN